MKTVSKKSILLIGIIVFFFLEQFYAQEKPHYVDLGYIVKKLESTSQNKEKIVVKLIEEIQERKVNFILTKENEEFLRKKGSNDLLVKTIQENVSKDVPQNKSEIDEMESLYQKFLSNRKGSGLENYKIALETAREYLEKSEKTVDCNVAPYIKYQIPKLEEKIEEISLKSGIITDEKEYLWQKFLHYRKSPSIENYETALKTAKKYLEKFGNVCGERIDYLYYQISKLEAKIKSLQN